MSSSGFRTKHLAIVGLGLMGGGLAMALRDHAETITGVDMNAQVRQYALANGIVDSVTDDLYKGVHEADTVILAAPVRVITEILQKRIGSYLRSNTLLIDIGSTKYDICESMGHLPVGINAIGGHPMTGKENSGIEAADPTIYHGRPFVLCKTRRTTPSTRLRALLMVEAIGAEVIEMEAERHDRIVAGISHLPYILSASMVATVAKEAGQDEAFWQLAAGGFRDMSRLAASDIKMMGDILSTNTRAVATLLAMFRVQLAQIETMLISGEHDKLIGALRPVRKARLDWVENYEQKRNGHTNGQTRQPTEGTHESSG
ncbi:MAG: prephenate dehydrogenase/arogenate dehydrogenase family protein [Anaerolineae bacterium]|nr:prephenate dehydrogenase/arogenate dehydrogenase family protein [Anaerolineae bacterium]MDQ7035728.1 prephenate dehydrogenase/arogenate dehydrogenase family protein [Anaerolineae bacterium]